MREGFACISWADSANIDFVLNDRNRQKINAVVFLKGGILELMKIVHKPSYIVNCIDNSRTLGYLSPNGDELKMAEKQPR